ncbi:MAG: hypothetical protein AAGD92_05235 [Pseudomonadota bacterium]
MGSIVRGRGPAYDVKPAGESPVVGAAGFCKDTAQGACSGLLGLLGATHMTGARTGIAEIQGTVPYIDSIWSALAAGGLAGPVELLGGVALFFAARRTFARTIGLLAFIAYIVAYMNGYTATDMLSAVSTLLGNLAVMLEPSTPA